ncbi:MAG: UpxY family transcription antiterminator [Terracidiphilus sp.]
MNPHPEDIPTNGHSVDAALENPAPQWFAVYTSPRHEKRVSQYMVIREIVHYLPIYQVRRKWRNGATVVLDLPLFPGYLFVRIERGERVRVLEVPGVLSFVDGTGGKPSSLPDAEIDALRSGLPLRHAEPHTLLTVGQRARICSGPLAGMVGVVVRQKNSLRVVLTMDMIMQSVSVEVDGSELESLDAEPPNPGRASSSEPSPKTRIPFVTPASGKKLASTRTSRM